MTTRFNKRVEEIAERASAHSCGERIAFLDDACGDDGRLRAAVEELVSARARANPRSDDPYFDTHAPTLPTVGGAEDHLPAALRVGSYQILSALGEGSMGVVYRAQQDNPDRVVALKVLKAGGTAAEALRRFEHEAQTLGRLQHPGIAQIFEAGKAETAYGPRPFFAMELVQGVLLTEFASVHRLNDRQRVALLVKICDGVQHAHQKGVIHRDLKPANILVDESGQPKILDFGIALTTAADLQISTSRSDLNRLAGTIPYMSWEQLSGDPDEIDTRSDVYALGVIAYELLTGRLPYDLKGRSGSEVVRVVGGERPRPPSAINRRLGGDLDAIVGKALERDKERRYQSAAELAADIQRFLSDEPVLAHPSSAVYQLRKFAQRNKALCAGGVGVALMMLVAIVGTSIGLGRATRAEAKERAVNAFLIDDLLAAGTPEREGRHVTVREVVDRAAQKIENGSLKDDPEVEAAVRVAMGMTYRSLALYEAAEPHLVSALQTRRRILGIDHRDTLTSMAEFALLLKARGELAQAEALFRETLDRRRRVLGHHDPSTLETQNNLARVLQERGDLEGAEAMYRDALSVVTRVLGDEHANTLAAMNNLASVLNARGEFFEAQELWQSASQIQHRVLGAKHPNTLKSLNNLAVLLKVQGKWSEAEPLYREVLETRGQVLGTEHPDTLTSMSNLAALLKAQGKLAEAEQLHRQALEVRQRVLGADHPQTLTSMNNLAALLQKQQKLPEAQKLFRETVGLLRHKLGDAHPHTIRAIFNLATLLARQGMFAESEALHREALAMRRRLRPEGHPNIAVSLIRVGMVMMERHDPAGAESFLREALAIRRNAYPEGDWRTANTASVLGECLTSLEGFDEAESLLVPNFPAIRAQFGGDDGRTERALQRIVKLYEAWDKPDQAARWRAELAD